MNYEHRECSRQASVGLLVNDQRRTLGNSLDFARRNHSDNVDSKNTSIVVTLRDSAISHFLCRVSFSSRNNCINLYARIEELGITVNATSRLIKRKQEASPPR